MKKKITFPLENIENYKENNCSLKKKIPQHKDNVNILAYVLPLNLLTCMFFKTTKLIDIPFCFLFYITL